MFHRQRCFASLTMTGAHANADVAPASARRREFGRGRSCRHGFTLVELLLVIIIIGVVSAVTMPSFVQSVRGNRMRSAARTVSMAARYARSMCLLNQREMAIRFDLEGGRVQILGEPTPGVAGGPGEAPDGPTDWTPPPEGDRSGRPMGLSTNSVADGWPVELERDLDKVQIESVAIEGAEEAAASGSCTVTYRSNGTCTPYTVRLVDEEGAAVRVKVDALSSVETERER